MGFINFKVLNSFPAVEHERLSLFSQYYNHCSSVTQDPTMAPHCMQEKPNMSPAYSLNVNADLL